jgi:hypothetical protein
LSRREKRLSIFIMAGCMAAVSLLSAFAGYGVATRAAGGEAAILRSEGAEPIAALPTATPPIRVVEPQTDTIAIPGFKKLTAEGQTLHAGAITNPEQNGCYFVVTLIMPGGAELYRSTYLAPGESLGDVDTLVPLAAGAYEGVTAKYSCYTMDDLKPLNGADITLTLEVLE